MTQHRPVLPHRTDLTTRRTRVAAKVMLSVFNVVERVKSRLLVEVPHPDHDHFYSVPDNLDAFRPGEVLDARPIEVRAVRRLINADAWQVKFRSTDTRGAAVSGVTTVMIPRRPFDGSVRPLLSYQPAIDSLGPAEIHELRDRLADWLHRGQVIGQPNPTKIGSPTPGMR
jgi:hypothetical protein